MYFLAVVIGWYENTELHVKATDTELTVGTMEKTLCNVHGKSH